MILYKGKINAVLANLVQGREVYVPAIVDGVAKFARYDNGVEPAFDLVNTLMPPKDLLFPQTQKMYSFSLGEDGNYRIDEYDDSVPRAIVGIRPCDMRSLVCLDDVFLTKGFVDEFYANAREKLLTVCIGCAAPAQTCFCDSMGVDPTDAPNADVMLRDAGDDWIVEAHTPKGEQVVYKPAVEGLWTCSCGKQCRLNFCTECGKPRPAADWTCSCGTVNKGKFCSNCGSPRP